jgi:dehydrogenase/reductase SDR family protein 4
LHANNIKYSTGILQIGRAIAERLCEEGASVLLCSRKKKNVDETVNEMRARGFDVHGMTCNVADIKEQEAFVQKAVDLWGKIDVVVANAGVNPAAGPTLSTSSAAYDKTMGINVKSVFELVALAEPHLNKGASLLFVSSTAAYQPSQPLGIYGVSKTALVSLTKVLAQELGPKGIRVNALCPGLVRTRFASALWKSDIGKQQRESLWLRRLGDPVDMAGPASFMLSEDASFMTGESLVVSGGTYSRL